MATNAGRKLKLSLNYKGISLEQCRNQSKLFRKAFTYLIKPSWQLAISQIFLSIIPLTTFFFAARINHASIIAVGFGISLSNMIGIGFCYALTTACEELAVARTDFSDAAIIVQRGLFISLSVVCLPVWAVWINSNEIFKLFGQEAAYSSLGEEFCFTFLPALPLFLLVLLMQKFMYLVKQTDVLSILLCNFFGAIANAGLNAVFVIWLKMGVRGSALATVLAYLCLTVISFLCIMWKPKYRAAWPGWQWSLLLDWGPYALKSFPYFLWIAAEWWTLDAGIYIVGTFHAFDRRISSQLLLCFIIHFLSMVTHQFTAEAADQIKDAIKGNYKRRAVFIVKCTVLVTWLGGVICGVLLAALNYMIPSSFLNNRPFVFSTAELIVLIAPIPFLKGTQAIGFNVMRKMGARYAHFVIVLVGHWIIAVPIAICLVYLGEWRIRGLWTGYLLGLFFQAIFFLIRLKSYMNEWMYDEWCGVDAPQTPSGTLKNNSNPFEEVDGAHGCRSLLLNEPRVYMRFNSVEITRENAEDDQRPRRPSARVLISRSLIFCMSSSILIAGLVIRYAMPAAAYAVSKSN